MPQTAATYVPYADAVPILRALRDDLLPPELRGRTPVDLEAAWSEWVARRDAAIRARVDEGDADSIIYLLQFGTTFTRQPRISERELAGVVVRQAGGSASRFVPSPVLLARIDDFVAAVASPGASERMQFARQVVARRGIDPATESGSNELRRYLRDRVEVVGQAERLSRLMNPTGDSVDQMTLFRDRGLASDTSILVDFGIEEALTAVKAAGLLQQGAVRRVAIVGPGLDFTDKQEGHDFYPEQTIQPFALIDSLLRLGLGDARELRLTAFDLSPRVLGHLDEARRRARAGRPYTVVLPRNLDHPWTPNLIGYWERVGDRIGETARAAAPPPTAGRLDVRGVSIRPSVVLSVVPQDLNIVLQRVEPLPADDQFDLVLASNLLIYYDVFEQSLAVTNVAKMLRPGGVFLTNDRVVELPGSALAPVGQTSAIYLMAPGIGDRGDRIDWYQRR
ncbi:MAG: class I SAM-dependent methyltransferase [Vicinamibacterales bacterium]